MITLKAISSITAFVLLLIMLDVILFAGISQAATPLNVTQTSSSTSVYSDLSQYEWPQFTGDAAFSHFSSGPAPEAADVLWKTNIDGIQPYISAFNNKIYVCTQTTVYAINEYSGQVLWGVTMPQSQPWPAVYKIDAHHMVIGNSCYDPDTGQVLWTSSDFSAGPVPIFNYGAYSPEEKMFFTRVNSFVQGWNFSDPSKPPELLWQQYVAGSGIDGSGIQYGDGKVYPGSFEAHQVALDAKTGQIVWDTNTKDAMLFSGTYDNGKFFRGGAHDNTFYAFDATTGAILWTYSPGTADGYFCTGTAAAYGMVYALNRDGNLYAFDEDTGKLVWKYTGPGPLMFPGNPTIADGKIYATTGQAQDYGGINSTSEFACLDAYTGQVIWKMPIEAFAPRESVAIAYGNLYLIPGDVTTAVDTISGSEYSTANQVWAISTVGWSMFRDNPAHTAVGQSGPDNLTLRWTFQTGGAVVSSPSIDDGIAYFGSQDKNIYAVDARSGSLIWKFGTQDRIESSQAIVNGKVYTGADDGYIYCLDAYNGSLLWKTLAGGDLPGNFNAAVQLRSSPTVIGGAVYVGALDNKTYCLNANDGSVFWTFQTLGFITSSPAVVDGAVYVVSQEPQAGALYKLSANNGALMWKHIIPYESGLGGGTDMHASPTVANGMVFCSSSQSAHYAVNATTGETIWTYKDPTAGEFIVSSPIYENGEVIIIDKFSLVSLNSTDGHILWSSFIGDELYVSPTYADGKIYEVTDERSIYVLNATNGTKLDSFPMGSNSWSAPSIYEGRVYVGCNDWKVYCLSEYPPLSSSITVSLQKSSAQAGELITGAGQLTPGVADTIVTVMLVDPNNTVINSQTITNDKGAFTFTFTPFVPGNWTVAAEWLSNKGFYTSSVSQMATLLVNPQPTPSPTQTPTPTPTTTPFVSPTPSPVPWDKLTFQGIPILYVYLGVIAALIAVIAIASYFYMKTSKKQPSTGLP
ncbi:MAG TPA: PQQ-binding-like beta-propeller repeat protein [Candidatus Nanoarchaeia archaeon]|nr:PQQ-binding-like beta-propeller repeat protein [Candidatus Nanoarchaeia archaeon]